MRLPLPALAPAACAALLLAAPPAGARALTPRLPLTLEGDESVAATDDARAFLVNPAALGLRYPSELLVAYGRADAHHEYNTELATWRRLGFVAQRIRDTSQTYGVAFALGPDRLRFGWTSHFLVAGQPTKQTVGDHRVGVLWRPSPWLSGGFTVARLFQPQFRGENLSRHYTLGLGLRPLARGAAAAGWGTRLTLTGDVTVVDDGEWRQARTQFGLQFEPVPGLVVSGLVQDHSNLRLGIGVYGVHASAHVAQASADGDRLYESYALSLHGGEDRTAFAGAGERRVAEIRAGGVLADEAAGAGLEGGDDAVAAAPLARQLERARRDPLTRGVLLDLDGVAGMAQLEELRPRIAHLRQAGKPVVAFMEDGGGRGDLYLASACDRVYASEPAEFSGLGLRVERRYWRRLLSDLGVRVERSSFGAFKSAYREFSVDSTPPADTTEIQQLLARQQELFVHAVSDGRRIPPERLLPALDGRDWPAARLARLGVIDSVGWREDALAELGRLTGLGRSPRTVDLRRAPAARRAWALPRRVAVVYAGGDIEVGESGSSLLDGPYMGSDTVIRQLEQAFHARGVRAVVLRVDSPGGSVLASRLIDHAIERLERETGRPLVVSMASVAASGGYMIACHADCIYADRFTHTGSIGVLFLKPSLQGLYAKLHVREDDFERGDYMGGLSYARDWRPQDQASADSVIRRLYHTFVNQVADGRRLQGFEVDAAAQGRVWLGEDALDRHLVDGLGGLDAAIEEARRRGGVPAGEPIGLLEFHHPAPPLLQRLLGRAVREEWEQTVRAAGVSGVRAEEDDAARSLAR